MSAAPYATRAEQWFAEQKQEERSRQLKVLVAAAVVALYPFVDSALDLNLLGQWIPIFVFVILALGLNVVVGYAGLLDLGYVAFFVIGAYGQAFLTSPNSVFVQRGWVPEFMQNFWPAMLFSWAFAAVFGVILGAPTLRLRGDYLAIVTLGFGEIVPAFFTNAETITNGPQGIGQIANPPSIPLPGGREIGFTVSDQRNWFWLVLVVVLFTLFMILRLYNSRLGRAWQAIREDEIAAASMGINTVSTKLWAFALGASFSGFAGAVYAGYVGVVYPDQFQFSVSIIILAMVILGGIGNAYGVIAGALIIGVFDRILTTKLTGPINSLGEQITWPPLAWLGDFLANHNLNSDRFLIFGLALVLLMLLRPGGLFPSKQRAAELQGDQEGMDPDLDENDSLYDVRHENVPFQGRQS
ncbi:MAG TPA: branched-chain amino acid ABC transporter permease [Thermomicrobiales bacterium]|nr:branched-chain amino acid ABC transporter permease [Thermomicrobiales bacterium]